MAEAEELDYKSISIKDFTKICRTCLCEDETGPIFEMIVEDIKAVDLLEYSVSLKINEADLYPQNICENCLKELYRIYEFKKQCHENEAVLKILAETSTPQSQELPPPVTTKQEKSRIKAVIDDDSFNITLLEDIPSGDESPSEEKYIPAARKRSNPRKPNSIQCPECKQVFDTKSELLLHRKKNLSCRSGHECPICTKKIPSGKMRQHMRIHTREKPYQCDVCSQGFSVLGNLKRHTMIHTGERPHICSICGKGFIQATSLHAHEKTHETSTYSTDTNTFTTIDINGSVQFSCSFCGRGFKRRAAYKAHVEKHASDKKIIVTKKRKSLDSDEDNHQHLTYVCESCPRSFKSKHLLKAHRLTHGEKSFLCSDCGKGFVTKAALQSHLRVHTGEKPHTCVICKKSFAHVGSFDSHMLIHLGHKPYACQFCTKSFTQMSHLTYHLRTHSGERPYACTYCGKTFALKGNLTVHVRTHTGETPYVCPVCNKGFYDSSSLKKHRKLHHENENQQFQVADGVKALSGGS